MNRPEKMNILYKIGFILMIVCIVLLAAALFFMMILKRETIGVLIAAGGAALCLAAIILTILSKPRKSKSGRGEKFQNDGETVLTEYYDDDIIIYRKGK